MELKKILNPVDGSPHSLAATRYAVELAQMVKAEIILVHCHRRFPIILAEPYFQKAINAIMAESEKLVEPFKDILEKNEIPHEIRLLEGSAGEVIPEVAEIEKADIIIMGSRGVTNLEGLILGSVAHKVLHSAACPVLIVK